MPCHRVTGMGPWPWAPPTGRRSGGWCCPPARSGVIIAVMLGVGRAIGETMAVMMVTGNAARMPQEWNALFLPVRTMTATIAAEMGEVAQGSTHYHVLFAVGILLFVVTFVINAVASVVIIRGGPDAAAG